jgi:NhaP-type Na+/H+ or K+/H+ antiporter
VIPLAWIINEYARWKHGDRDPSIPRNHQLMIWWAGLRGAIAFALSFEVEGEEKSAIQTTILVVCIISIIVLGATTPFALKHLNIQTGISSPSEDDEEVELRGSFDSDILPVRPNHWFLNFDESYLKPVFLKDNRIQESPSRNTLLY